MLGFSQRLSLALIFSVTAYLCLTCNGAAAEPQPKTRRPRIGLVLEGGGAKGFAHVGVIKVLEEEHIPVHLVAGTSMGSIVGAAFASGRTVAEMEKVLSATNWDKLFNEYPLREYVNYRQKAGRDKEIFGDAKFGIQAGSLVIPAAMVQGQKVEPLLQALFGKVPSSISFDALPVPFRAVAADIETGEMVVLDHGSLARAARASMSVPGFFAPVEIDGRLLVDGGISDNFPVDVALDMGADVLIAVEIPDKLRSRAQLKDPLAISGQILDLLLERTTQSRLKMLRPQDILVRPEMGKYGSTSFQNAREIMKIGEDTARKLIPALRRLALPEAEFADYYKHRTNGGEYAPVIYSVRVENVSGYREQAILAAAGVKLGESLDRQKLDQEIAALHESGGYKKIGYEVEQQPDGRNELVIKAEEKEWTKNYLRLGFSLEDDFEGDNSYTLATGMRFNDLNSSGAYGDVQAEVGRAPRLFGELYQPLGIDSPFFIAPDASFGRQDLLITKDSNTIAKYTRTVGLVGLKGGISLGRFGEFATGLRRGQGKFDREIGETSLPNFDYQIGEATARFVIDQLDDRDFPTKGVMLDLSGASSRGGLGASNNYDQGRTLFSKPFTFGATTVFLNTEAGFSSNDIQPEYIYALGGFMDISGYQKGSLQADNYWVGRMVVYHRLSEGGSSLLPFGGYAGFSVETANLRNDIATLGDRTGIVAGSVFFGADTPLLPVYIGYGMSNESERSFYLNVGRFAGRRR